MPPIRLVPSFARPMRLRVRPSSKARVRTAQGRLKRRAKRKSKRRSPVQAEIGLSAAQADRGQRGRRRFGGSRVSGRVRRGIAAAAAHLKNAVKRGAKPGAAICVRSPRLALSGRAGRIHPGSRKSRVHLKPNGRRVRRGSAGPSGAIPCRPLSLPRGFLCRSALTKS